MKLNSAIGATIIAEIEENIPNIPPIFPIISKIEVTLLA